MLVSKKTRLLAFCLRHHSRFRRGFRHVTSLRYTSRRCIRGFGQSNFTFYPHKARAEWQSNFTLYPHKTRAEWQSNFTFYPHKAREEFYMFVMANLINRMSQELVCATIENFNHAGFGTGYWLGIIHWHSHALYCQRWKDLKKGKPHLSQDSECLCLHKCKYFLMLTSLS